MCQYEMKCRVIVYPFFRLSCCLCLLTLSSLGRLQLVEREIKIRTRTQQIKALRHLSEDQSTSDEHEKQHEKKLSKKVELHNF